MSGPLAPGSPPVNPNGAAVGTVVAPPPPPPTDQQRFDADVQRDGKIVLQVLGGITILAALLMSTIALVLVTQRTSPSVVAAPAAAAATVAPVAPSGPVIDVSIAGSNKRGPDGKMHDSFSQTNFSVKVGQATQMRINNTDSSPHSITAADAGVSIIAMPGAHTYTMTATKAGRFEWVCAITCDSGAAGWAMTHPGYMAGYITAT